MTEEIKAKRDELAEEFYNRTGFVPTEWAINNFYGGFDAGFALAMGEARVLVERLEILIAEGYANQIDKKALKEFKAKVGE